MTGRNKTKENGLTFVEEIRQIPAMTKKDYIEHWKTSAEDDWRAVNVLAGNGNRVQALFWAHLVLEKLLKAHWIKDNEGDFPPRVHNLEFLLSQTTLEMSSEDIDELRIANAWNIEGRYPDYKDFLFRITTPEYVAEKLPIANKIRTWLLDQLQ